jgi:hypothetical protein
LTLFHIFLLSFKKPSKKQATRRATRLFVRWCGLVSLRRTSLPLQMTQLGKCYFKELGLMRKVLLHTADLHDTFE